MMNEQVIIKKCQRGDLEEFGLLYDQYIKKIYDFIYYKTHHKETAEDLTSLTFMKALGNINTYKATKGTFSAWLYQIARNTVIDYYRTRKSDVNITDVWDLSSDENLDQDMDSKEKLKDVKKYLKKLTGEQRDIVIMRVWQEMSYQEIAVIMNKSEASCKMMFSRTIRILRKEMPLVLIIYLLIEL